MTAPTFRTLYDGLPTEGQGDFGPSLTRQEFLEESDVNHIIDQYEKHGILPEEKQPGIFGDFTDPVFTDYQHAQNIILAADYSFGQLDARIRERFKNNPADLIAFLQDERNIDEAIELGIIDKPKPKVETPAAATPPAVPPQVKP